MKIKIIGAGSIGNHLAQAARRMNWEVCVVDQNKDALERMKTDIYPTRYGAWDESITLYESKDEPRGGFDVIFIGTPPHVRMPIAIKALEEKPRVIQLEKPLSDPHSPLLDEFIEKYITQSDTVVISGYDHAISESISFVISLLRDGVVGKIETVDVEFREHWKGIFSAHPWLSGPEASYLGYSEKGGGASGEHSHALHLWQLLAREAGLGKWVNVSSVLKMEKHDKGTYDSIAHFSFVTDKGEVGRVVQDVVTFPVKKFAYIQGKDGFIEWICNGNPEGDVVKFQKQGEKVEEKVFKKIRRDDFYAEMLHIDDILTGNVKGSESPLSFESAVSVMEVLATVHGREESHVSVPIKSKFKRNS